MVFFRHSEIPQRGPGSEAEIRALSEIFTPIRTTVMSKDEYAAAVTAG